MSLFFTITGFVGFCLWIPAIVRALVSFYLMPAAKLSALMDRANFSFHDMKVINLFLSEQEHTFMRLKNADTKLDGAVMDHYDGSSYDESVKIASQKDKESLQRLSSLFGYFRFPEGGLSSGDHSLDERLHFSGAFITEKFKRIFHWKNK